MRKWCRTLESEYGINYFKTAENFEENIEWYVGWGVHYGSATRWEKWYQMSDGTIVQIGRLAYSPDSWCVEFSHHEGIKKLIESIKADIRRHDPIIHIKGAIPETILKILPKRLTIVET